MGTCLNLTRILLMLLLATSWVLGTAGSAPLNLKFKLLEQRNLHQGRQAARFLEERGRLLADAPSVTLRDGDVVTCLNTTDQPSLENVTNPVVLTAPSAVPNDSAPKKSREPLIQASRQTYTRKRRRRICPVGTIPYRTSRTNPNPYLYNDTSGLGFQEVYGTTNGSTIPAGFLGTKVSMNVWRPFVERSYEESLVYLWLVFGENDLFAGWGVVPDYFGDNETRLFGLWSAGEGNVTQGCVNLDCAGFVQVSNKVLLGGSLFDISVTDGTQYEITFNIFLDNGTNAWWLQIGDEYVGYWPTSLFIEDADTGFEVSIIQWEGSVLSSSTANYSGATDLGSGSLAETGFLNAAYMRNIQYVALNNTLIDANDLLLNDEDANVNCYDIVKHIHNASALPSDIFGAHFFYGGPGASDTCTNGTRST